MNYLTYKKRFNKILADHTPILDKDGNQLQNPEKEKWVQCYSPNDKVRKQYPKYLFVSDKGNFVSLNNMRRPKLLTPSLTSNDRESYNISVNGKTRRSLGYIVVAVCHGAKTFGKADEVMAAKGRLAFGKSGELLQVHHEEGYVVGDRDANNNPEKLVILTVNIHKLFQKAPTEEASPEEQLTFLKEFADRVSKETNEPVIMIPSGKDNGTIENFEYTEEQRKDLVEEMMNNKILMKPLTDDKECLKDFETRHSQIKENSEMCYRTFGVTAFISQETIKTGKTYEVMNWIFIK